MLQRTNLRNKTRQSKVNSLPKGLVWQGVDQVGTLCVLLVCTNPQEDQKFQPGHSSNREAIIHVEVQIKGIAFAGISCTVFGCLQNIVGRCIDVR